MKNTWLLIVSLFLIVCAVILYIMIRKGFNPFKKKPSSTDTSGDESVSRQPLLGPLATTEVNNYLSYYTIYQIAMLNAGVSEMNERLEKLEKSEWI